MGCLLLGFDENAHIGCLVGGIKVLGIFGVAMFLAFQALLTGSAPVVGGGMFIDSMGMLTAAIITPFTGAELPIVEAELGVVKELAVVTLTIAIHKIAAYLLLNLHLCFGLVCFV